MLLLNCALVVCAGKCVRVCVLASAGVSTLIEISAEYSIKS